MNRQINELWSQWAKVGVAFSVQPTKRVVDLEQLLLDTARTCSTNSRLYVLSITWISVYGDYIAKKRLGALIKTLEPRYRPVLGLILDLAVKHGAPAGLGAIAKRCSAAPFAHPLFEVDTTSSVFAQIAQETACKEALAKNIWASDVEIKLDTLRSPGWILEHNPSYGERVVRKGDIRCSILEVLRHDARKGVPSESKLAQLCSASRSQVRDALDDLEREGWPLRRTRVGNRTPITLKRAS